MQSRITVAHLPGDASDDHLLLPTSRVGHFPDFVAPNLNLLGLSIDCFKSNTKSFSLYSNKTVNINRNSTNSKKSAHHDAVWTQDTSQETGHFRFWIWNESRIWILGGFDALCFRFNFRTVFFNGLFFGVFPFGFCGEVASVHAGPVATGCLKRVWGRRRAASGRCTAPQWPQAEGVFSFYLI